MLENQNEKCRAELKTLKDELERNRSENKDLNEKMEKWQKNLDCSSNQQKKDIKRSKQSEE